MDVCRWNAQLHHYGADPVKVMRKQSGFSLVELMVGLVIGLVTTLAVAQIIIYNDQQKRTATGGVGAQVSAALAMNALIQEIEQAGYGFGGLTKALGCPLVNKFAGSGLQGMPSVLAPVQITFGQNGASDKIRILSSSKTSYSVPTLVNSPGYSVNSSLIDKPFVVNSARGVAAGDLMIAATDASANCELFQASGTTNGTQVDRNDDTFWNASGWPDTTYSTGAYLINMGTFNDHEYSIDGHNNLALKTFNLASDGAGSYVTGEVAYNNIVQIKALYGKAANNATNTVDTWDAVTPTTPAQWQSVVAIRLALVGRSTQMEKDVVTSVNPTWDIGKGIAVSTSVDCSTSKCITLNVSGLPNWKYYRYKVVDAIIPLRNFLWTY